MMIKCGHVVSNDSLHKLSKVDGWVIISAVVSDHEMNCLLSRRVKCPYCPVESTLGGALRVHF